MEYTRVFTAEEQQILEHDLLDITTWIDAAIDGKLNNCGKRAAQQYDALAKEEDLATVPTKDADKRAAGLLGEFLPGRGPTRGPPTG